ncbi:RNA polymerase sigma factor [Falsochrobactrum sp. TDYN1]|uniref:RNA polymerase sigma factor n=1 Tax=Falsochrobactrum tianjinense TaxID=2706015 RepID=A0A949UVI9_9HYPH|nr:RNA polymerase sigma factor [Falsochrobactrum sp. TDYN1]MBV2144103.1 RNA polymerase sigma factor [Falsochrobactrum sp. TDYN1]
MCAKLADPAASLLFQDDIALARCAIMHDAQALRKIMQTNNRRLYRLARGIVGNEAEAEDVVQETYLLAFRSLERFRGQSSLTTWLSRIAINEALGRLRKNKRTQKFLKSASDALSTNVIQFPVNMNSDNPEHRLAQREILQLIERATDNLPETFRLVFIARVIEGLSVDETAELLALRPETVKTRLHRARYLIRKQLDEKIGPVLLDAFPFAGKRCERIIAAVFERLNISL